MRGLRKSRRIGSEAARRPRARGVCRTCRMYITMGKSLRTTREAASTSQKTVSALWHRWVASTAMGRFRRRLTRTANTCCTARATSCTEATSSTNCKECATVGRGPLKHWSTWRAAGPRLDSPPTARIQAWTRSETGKSSRGSRAIGAAARVLS